MRDSIKIIGLLLCSALLMFGVHLALELNTSSEPSLSVGDTYPLKVELITEKTEYKKSEYVTFSMKITNVSHFLLEEDHSGCPNGTEVYVDQTIDLTGKPKHGICLAMRTSRPLGPGESFTTPTMQFDLGYIEGGQHSLQAKVAYIDPNGYQYAMSNEVRIKLNPADQVYNCNHYAREVNTICDQIMIRTSQNRSADENNKICKNIRNNHIFRHHPNPVFIKDLSTAECNDGRPAVFVFNIEPEQTDFWRSIPQRATKKDFICSSTKFSIDWLKNPTYSTSGWNNC